MKTLIVVESPAKAKTISKYLGDDYVVLASFGHVIDLSKDPTFGRGMGIDVEDNFKTKYSIMPDKQDKVNAICGAANNVDLILLATDPDREGEAISWHLADVLEKYNKPIKRVLFKEITKSEIIKAIKNPVELDANLYDAQQARRVLDRLVGFMASPYVIKAMGKGNSAGRVQSVVVKMIVDRDKEIDSFEPEEYWSIVSTLENDKFQKLNATYNKKINNEKNALNIKKDLLSDIYTVSNVDNKEKERPAPPPLITSSLVISASSKYRFNTEKTMKAAQTLFESGLITYMRTDSLRCSDESIDDCRDWLVKNSYDVPSKPLHYVKGKSQDGHEAIRPTDVSKTPDSIYKSEDEKKIYKLIWERFVASQMKPAIFSTASVTIDTSSGHSLKSNGKIIKYNGWLEITKDNLDDKDEKLPNVKKGEILNLVEPKVVATQKFTQPPSPYNEGTLVKELEKRGIGRPATYKSIMSKITHRNYVKTNSDKKKLEYFVSTKSGKDIVEKLSNTFDFMEYKYTSDMEEKLDLISEGKLNYVEMLHDFFDPFKKQLQSAYNDASVDYGIKCDVCTLKMMLKEGKFGYYLKCSGKGCYRTFSCDMVDGKPVIKSNGNKNTVSNVSCPNCSSGMVKRSGKFGEFYACIEYPKCRGVKKVPYGRDCKSCGGDLYLKEFSGKTKLACMNYPTCTNIEEVDV